ncbi:unnamed protein product [Hanseniaspora opuntiae]
MIKALIFINLIISLLCAGDNNAPIFLKYSNFTSFLMNQHGYNFLNYVDPFYGTERGGNRFPGVLYPFGMVKVGGDFRHATNHLKTDSYAGYQKHGFLRQISLLHVSGTGGSPTYGVVGQMPLLLESNTDLKSYDLGMGIERKKPDTSHLGYYKIQLSNSIDIEFTAAKKSSIIRYTVQEDYKNKHFVILVNTTECLNSFNRPWWSQKVVNSKIMINEDQKSYKGFIEVANGWASTDSFIVYYYAEFDKMFKNVHSYSNKQMEDENEFYNLAAFFDFGGNVTKLTTKIGVSYLSIEQAKINLENDFGKAFDFNGQVIKTINIWKNEVFDKVTELEVQDSIVLEKFYNSLYGSHLMPTDKSGVESPFYLTPNSNNILELTKSNFDNKFSLNMISDMISASGIRQVGFEPFCERVKIPNNTTAYYDDWFTLWDTYRTLHPLLFIVQPQKSKDMINSLALISEYEGFAPDGRSGGRSGRTQGGSNSDIVISEAFRKNIVTDLLERCRLYRTSWRNANTLPPYFFDRSAKDSTNKFGRGALEDWVSLDYVSTDFSRSLTRTVEYSNNDFCLAIMSSEMGEDNIVTNEYLRRSRNWINLWDKNLELNGYNYKGFLCPKHGLQTRGKYKSIKNDVEPENIFKRKHKTGSFLKEYNPADCGGCYWGDHSYEGTSIEYMFSINHDITKLISILDGGAKEFEQRLDDLYNLNCDEDQAKESQDSSTKFKSLSGKNCGFADVANEPSFGAGYLYNYIGNQDKTAATIDFLTTVEFGVGTRGIPGNSDSGAMESWLWFGLIGFYPVPGTDIYLIGTPQIERLNIRNKLLIKVYNLDPDEYRNNVRKNVFIEKVKLNDKILERNWMKHGELFDELHGSLNILEFFMAHEPLHWDAQFEPPPTFEELLHLE